jgi:hypothetical protein
MGHAVVSGILGGLLATLFIGWAGSRAQRVDADPAGWRTVRAGAAVWLPILISAALSLGLLSIYVFVGSSRADAASQMRICLGLAIAFAGGALAVAWSAFARALSWRGDELQVRPLIGAPVAKRFSELAEVQMRASGLFRLTFADGYAVSLSPYMLGAKQLLEALGHPTGRDTPWASP